jgi:hypothetical protein
MKRRPLSRSPRSALGTRAGSEGIRGQSTFSRASCTSARGTVSDLQTGIVQTTNYDLDFPFIGKSSTVTAIRTWMGKGPMPQWMQEA